MRAARTDKGVSAIGQVVSLKMVVGFANYDVISGINNHLPDQIRVLGYTKTTAGFDARKHCDKRRYEYILPMWAFDPNSCRGRIDAEEAELASAANPTAPDGVLPPASVADQPNATDSGIHQASAKQAIAEATAAAVATEAVSTASSSAQKPPHAQGSAMADVDLPNFNPTQALQQVIPLSSCSPPHAPNQTTPSLQPGAENGPAQSRDQSGHLANGPAQANAPEGNSAQGNSRGPAPGDAKGPASDSDQPSNSGFVFSEADVQRLSSILKQYEGTHNFHNFTVRLESSDPSAKRYMLSCKCTGVFDIQVSSGLFSGLIARPALSLQGDTLSSLTKLSVAVAALMLLVVACKAFAEKPRKQHMFNNAAFSISTVK